MPLKCIAIVSKQMHLFEQILDTKVRKIPYK